MNITLYHVPIVDREHRNVIVNMRSYLELFGDSITLSVRDFSPSYDGFSMDIIAPNVRGWTYNYVTFTSNQTEWGCFIDNFSIVTPTTAKISVYPIGGICFWIARFWTRVHCQKFILTERSSNLRHGDVTITTRRKIGHTRRRCSIRVPARRLLKEHRQGRY